MATILEFPANKVARGVHSYTPEMGQRKPSCEMESRLSHSGSHYFIDTPIQLSGRGIKLIRQSVASDFLNPNNRRVGWYQYKVTDLAMDKLKQQYSISREALLD